MFVGGGCCPSEGTTCCSRTHPGPPGSQQPGNPTLWRGDRGPDRWARLPEARQLVSSSVHSLGRSVLPQMLAQGGYWEPIRSRWVAHTQGGPPAPHPEPQPFRRVHLDFLRPPPGVWSQGGQCSPGGLGGWHKFQCEGSCLPPGRGDSLGSGTCCPDGGSGSSPGSRTPGAKGESPPPPTQPPAGARGDARLGKHGASLGLK